MKYDGTNSYTLDIDATGIVAEKQAAKMTYKSLKGYMPMVGHIAENGLVVGDEFRQGNESPSARNLEFFKHCVKHMPKGKIERPYGSLQDRLIRTCGCGRDNVPDIKEAQRVLNHEIQRYNYKQVHSTTQEVPYFRFQRPLEEKSSLFREFKIRPPYQSVKDIFCLRIERTVDLYRKISINNLLLKVNNGTLRKRVTLAFKYGFHKLILLAIL